MSKYGPQIAVVCAVHEVHLDISSYGPDITGKRFEIAVYPCTLCKEEKP